MGRKTVVRYIVSVAVVAFSIALTGCGVVGGGDPSLVDANSTSTSEVLSNLSPSADLAQQQIQTLENQVNTLKEQLKQAREALAAAEERLAQPEEELRKELMTQIEQEINTITLERARLQAVQYAQQNQDPYGPTAQQQLVWEVIASEAKDEFYYITLSHRPFGTFTGTTGTEEFIMEKDGKIVFRQVISQPDANGVPPEPTPQPTPVAPEPIPAPAPAEAAPEPAPEAAPEPAPATDDGGGA